MYSKEEIYNKTNQGLDIVHKLFESSVGCEGTNKHFKIREEKTASANFYFSKKQNCWCVKDWGNEMKSPIDLYMSENNIGFKEAIAELAAEYGITKEVPKTFKPDIEIVSPKEGALKGDYSFIFSEEIPERALKILGVLVKQSDCDYFNLKHVESLSYTYECKNTKKLKTLVKKSTETYPIFAYDHTEWLKTYEPKAAKKSDRFRYYGEKPARFIFGLKQLNKRLNRLRRNAEEEVDIDKLRLQDATLVSGGSDAINLFSVSPDNNVLWFNGESEQINSKELFELSCKVKRVYNIPDADATGEKKAIELGNKFLDIRNIWLPEKLLKGRDARGGKLKDVKDLINKNYQPENPDGIKSILNRLYRTAIPFKFWDEIYSSKTKRYTYKFNTKQAIVFLSKNGFYKVESKNKDKKSIADRYYYVRKKENIVSITNQVEIKDFVNDFAEDKGADIGVLNEILNTTRLNEKTLQQLPLLELDFSNATKDAQYKHFKNGVLKITAGGVELLKTDQLDINVWEHSIIDRNVKVLDPMFNIDTSDPNKCKVDVLNQNCWFFNYLINASRVNWQKELNGATDDYKKANKFNIKGSRLTPEEQQEQQQHLANKIGAIGYYAYRFKKRSKAWQVIAMDEAVNSANGSGNGGSGKSLTWELAIKEWFVNTVVTVTGTDEVLNDKFAFENVTEETDAVLLVDTHKGYSTRSNFEKITGDFDVNPKNKKNYLIPFSIAPKIASTTNFVDSELDSGSKIRRSYPVLYADYYHSKTDVFNSEYSVRDDFEGNDLFSISEDEFSSEQWNMFYNFIAQCISFYLKFGDRIMPPLKNYRKRAIVSRMGATFYEWVNDYFSKNPDQLNKEISRRHLYDSYKDEVGKFIKTPKKFKDAIIDYCELKDYVFNPVDKINLDSTGRRIVKLNGTNHEMFFIEAPIREEQKALIEEAKEGNDFFESIDNNDF